MHTRDEFGWLDSSFLRIRIIDENFQNVTIFCQFFLISKYLKCLYLSKE